MAYKDQSKGQLINELKELRERLSGLEETTDKLTGLYNKDYFLDLAECEFIRSKRFQRPLSLILISIKDFNKIESEQGEKISNQIFSEVVNRCKTRVRDLDYFGRYDDDRMILLLPEADKSAVQKIAERLGEAVEKSPVLTDDGDIDVELCQGGAEISENLSVLDEFLAKAEEALLSAEKDDNESNIVVK
jgi:diguanylate cyclase (GGDEF)-like protein